MLLWLARWHGRGFLGFEVSCDELRTLHVADKAAGLKCLCDDRPGVTSGPKGPTKRRLNVGAKAPTP